MRLYRSWHQGGRWSSNISPPPPAAPQIKPLWLLTPTSAPPLPLISRPLPAPPICVLSYPVCTGPIMRRVCPNCLPISARVPTPWRWSGWIHAGVNMVNYSSGHCTHFHRKFSSLPSLLFTGGKNIHFPHSRTLLMYSSRLHNTGGLSPMWWASTHIT